MTTHDVLEIPTRQRCEMIEITHLVREAVAASGVQRGAAIVYVPHTTAGCTINENADPDVQHDMLLTWEAWAPKDRPEYRHAEGNSDAHVKASMLGFSQTVLIEGGGLVLGTWQGVYFVEFDGPRRRNLHVRVVDHEGAVS